MCSPAVVMILHGAGPRFRACRSWSGENTRTGGRGEDAEMQRILLWSVLMVGVLVLLVTSGVLDIHISLRPPSRAPAQELWRTSAVDRPLPEAFALWVELAKSARPAVVNVST